MRSLRVVFTLFVLVLLVGTLLPAQAQGNKPEAVGLRPDAPTYALHGPFWVGARDLVIADKERPLNVTVWYPALNPQNAKEEITYTVYEQSPIRSQFHANNDWAIKGAALANAPLDASKAPYPLVLYSHGAGGWRQEAAWTVEHLASMGFVVIAPDEPGDAPWGGFWQGLINRPNDMRRVIDYADTLTAPGGTLAGLIDMKHVGLVGWSMGGTTALATGGAQYDLVWFEKWCAERPDDQAAQLFCADIQKYRQGMLTMAKLTALPDGLWPAMGDPRVQAIVVESGVAAWFGPSGLAKVTIPVLVQVGSDDLLVVPQWNAFLTYDNIASAQKAKVVLDGGDHQMFESKCDAMPWIIKIGLFVACSSSIWDMDRAHDLTNHFTTAFLLDVLKGDKESHKALLPDAVQFPGIQYQTTLK